MSHQEIIREAITDITKVIFVDVAALLLVSNWDVHVIIKDLVGISAFGFTMLKIAFAISDRRRVKDKNSIDENKVD